MRDLAALSVCSGALSWESSTLNGALEASEHGVFSLSNTLGLIGLRARSSHGYESPSQFAVQLTRGYIESMSHTSYRNCS